jgi:hypothetical protein
MCCAASASCVLFVNTEYSYFPQHIFSENLLSPDVLPYNDTYISQKITIAGNNRVYFNLHSLYFSKGHVGTCFYDKE